MMNSRGLHPTHAWIREVDRAIIHHVRNGNAWPPLVEEIREEIRDDQGVATRRPDDSIIARLIYFINNEEGRQRIVDIWNQMRDNGHMRENYVHHDLSQLI
jgi:hypothetical protein